MAYSTIKKPSDYFNTKLYTGNGSTQSITGVGFQPDWVWFKSRTTTNNHALFDIIRGATNWIETNRNLAEATYSGGLTSFDSDGFSVGNGSDVNLSGSSQVAWNWLASNTTATNNDGTATSTVSANTTAGFSIVKFTEPLSANTVGHGLSKRPEIIFYKKLDIDDDFSVIYTRDGGNKRLILNSTGAELTTGYSWNDTVLGGLTGDSTDVIAYCFHSVSGFSKFGSYVGNGNADGTFVYTGFKPAFVIIKGTTIAGWEIADNKRTSSGGNVIDKELGPNDSDAETTNNYIDFLSNGFKLRNSFGNWNGSGATYIYMAFAEEPLVGDNPATAR